MEEGASGEEIQIHTAACPCFTEQSCLIAKSENHLYTLQDPETSCQSNSKLILMFSLGLSTTWPYWPCDNFITNNISKEFMFVS